MRPPPSGQPRGQPEQIGGIASRISGTVMVRGDSWIFGSTSGSTWLSP